MTKLIQKRPSPDADSHVNALVARLKLAGTGVQ